jgi:hypothetical protein
MHIEGVKKRLLRKIFGPKMEGITEGRMDKVAYVLFTKYCYSGKI